MAEFLLVSRSRMQELRDALADATEALDDALGSAGRAYLGNEKGEQLGVFDEAPPDARIAPNPTAREGGSYKISSTMSYADVVDREIGADVFPFDETWNEIEPLLVEPAKRARESCRRSLDNDSRFVRTKRGDGRIWYRRTNGSDEQEG